MDKWRTQYKHNHQMEACSSRHCCLADAVASGETRRIDDTCQSYQCEEFERTAAIRSEIGRFAPNYWDAVCEEYFRKTRRRFVGWAEHGLWWAKTTKGKAYNAQFKRKRSAVLKAILRGEKKCAACGKLFPVSEYKKRRGRDIVCSAQCRAKLRKNIVLHEIDGERKTLSDWCRGTGVKLKTAYIRLKRGWTVRRAVGFD
jgi:hypothetical protein